MRFTMFGEGEGVRCEVDGQFWAATADNIVTDASLSARKQGVAPGMPESAAKSILPQLTVHPEATGASAVMKSVWQLLCSCSPWLEVVGNHGFFLQVSGQSPPLREIRNLLALLEQQMTDEQRFRAGLAENPFLARALVEWSRLERVRGAQYYRVGRQQWMVSPSLAEWANTGRVPQRLGQWIKGIPIEALWTIPVAKRNSLQKLGVLRLAELRVIPVADLLRHFGKEALFWLQLFEQEPGGLIHNNYPPVQKRAVWQADIGDHMTAGSAHMVVYPLVLSLSSTLQKAGMGALKAGMTWETETGEHVFERAAKRAVCSADALLAVLAPGVEACTADPCKRVEVYVEDVRPLESVQTSFVIHEGAFVSQDQLRGKDLQRLLYQVNRKFPRALQVGLRPTFRELRLQAVLEAGW